MVVIPDLETSDLSVEQSAWKSPLCHKDERLFLILLSRLEDWQPICEEVSHLDICSVRPTEIYREIQSVTTVTTCNSLMRPETQKNWRVDPQGHSEAPILPEMLPDGLKASKLVSAVECG